MSNPLEVTTGSGDVISIGFYVKPNTGKSPLTITLYPTIDYDDSEATDGIILSDYEN